MLFKKLTVLAIIGMLYAGDGDEDIIKDLDFYMSMEMIEGETSTVDLYTDEEMQEEILEIKKDRDESDS